MIQLAKRIFASLPIERIRPEKRFIFIPEGKNNDVLAIAARMRLANLTDIPEETTSTEYASDHVIRELNPKGPIVAAFFKEENNVEKGLEIISGLKEGSQFAFIFYGSACNAPILYKIWKNIAIPDKTNPGYEKYHLLEFWVNKGAFDSRFNTCTLIGEKGKCDRRPLLRSFNLCSFPCEEKETKSSIGQVLEVSEDYKQIRLILTRFTDDEDEEMEGEWVPMPDNLPGWALDGTPFTVDIDKTINSYQGIRENPGALDDFDHEHRPYLTDVELSEFLRIPSLESKYLGVIGQVIEFNPTENQILLQLSGLLDDEDEKWLPIPPELPGWALDGTVFHAELLDCIETFAQLAECPSGLKNFKHTPHSYLTDEELKTKLSRMINK